MFINQLEIPVLNVDGARALGSRSATPTFFKPVQLQPGFARAIAVIAYLPHSFAWARDGDFVCTIFTTVNMQIKHTVLRDFLCPSFRRVTEHQCIVGYILGCVVEMPAFFLTYSLLPPALQYNNEDTAASTFPYPPTVCIMQLDCN